MLDSGTIMTLSLMIKKRYLAEKVEEQEANETFQERRAYKRFWRTRIGSTTAWRLGGKAVFLCGHESFPAKILNIKIANTPDRYVGMVGKVCYDIECIFSDEVVERLSNYLDEAKAGIREQIKSDFRTLFMRQHE